MAELRSALALYLRLVGVALRSQLQYRRAFVLNLLATFVLTLSEFATLLVLFGRFPRIGTWQVGDIAVLYGLASMSFALGEMLGDGFNTCSVLVRRGEFDRVLLRPAGAFLQILAAELQLRRAGRFVQGLVALLFGLSRAHVSLDASRLAVIPLVLICGAIIYFALFVLQATLCFWTTEGIEVANIVTNGGSQLASYPLEIFPSALRGLFTFVIPLAFVSYYPATFLLRKPDTLGLPAIGLVFTPLVALAFLAVAMRIWQSGVRHYQGTGN